MKISPEAREALLSRRDPRVAVAFAWDGIVGREVVAVEFRDLDPVSPDWPRTVEARAVGALERMLIEAGASTWECGCCCNDPWVSILGAELLE